MGRRSITWRAVVLVIVVPSAGVAQAEVQPLPLRFGVEFARATPTGAFARVAGPANGFVGWLALPLSRVSPIGIGAEFSVLTLPTRVAVLPLEQAVTDLTVDLRSTLTFVGVGPRIEAIVGPLAVGASAMVGFNRVITDLRGTFDLGQGEESVATSDSEYASALKGGVMAALPIYRGLRGTAVGLAGGADYTLSGRAPFPDQDSFGYDRDTQQLVIDRPEVALNHWRVHAGVSVEF